MQSLNIRQKLHSYVEKGDEKLLKLMYALAREYNDDDDFEYEFTNGDIELFEQRSKARLSGESKTYDRKEARDIILGEKGIK